MARPPEPRGRTLARALRGAWRASPPPLELSASELAAIAPNLAFSREAAMVWRRLPEPSASALLNAARHERLDSALVEHVLPDLVGRLQRAGVDPVLVKGWAVARHYGERGLRPLGDVDLCVPADDYERAACVLQCQRREPGVDVDLHRGFCNSQGERLLEDPAGEVFARTLRVPLGGGEVRVLGPEDHLRLVCVHMLRHGAIRPLWLCDVAAMVETLPAEFDWERCLGRRRPRSDWVWSSIQMARSLLGAEPSVALPDGFEELPTWIAEGVLQLWEDYREPESCGILTALRRPPAVYDSGRLPWRGLLNPLRALDSWHGPLRRLPRGVSRARLLGGVFKHLALYAVDRARSSRLRLALARNFF